MKLFGLIGYPLSHSFSQTYFREKFKHLKLLNYDYLNFPIEDISEIKNIIYKHPSLLGFNVTIPYKETILDYLDSIDEAARQIAAVNTVKVIRQNNKEIKLIGYNTDTYGFEESLKPFLLNSHKHALILGTGGASKAVAFVLKKRNIDYKLVSRKPNNKEVINYRELNKALIKKHTLIINTTPLGMYPHIENCPDIPYHFIETNHLLFDLVYNPEKTLFLKKGEKYGALTSNGYRMLEHQAEKAWGIFKSR